MEFLIDGLANYVANLTYDDLSDRAKEVAKQVILDSYGNMLFGCYSEASERIKKYASLADARFTNEAPVPLLGGGADTCLETAVFTHTMMARCADLDDGYSHAMGHPGSGLVPLLLSAGQMYHSSGKDMITAITAAYDIYARLGEAINPFMYRERGFDATGVCGAVAGAALLSKLRGKDAAATRHAMGLASLFTGGLIEYQNDGSSGKIMCSGWGALTAIRAVRLVECGFTGPDAALEGKYGFFQAFKGTSGHCDMSHVLEDLGKEFKITKIYFKRHACQRGLHAVMDTMLDLKAEADLTPAKVKKIDILTSSFVYRLSNSEPSTAVGAQASVQFCSAIAIKYGRMDSEELVFKSFTDPEIKDLVKRINVIKDDEVQQYLGENPTHFCAAKTILENVDGNVYEKWAPFPLGDVQSPFGWDILKEKFHNFIVQTPYLAVEDEYFNFLKNLEEAPTTEKLFAAPDKA